MIKFGILTATILLSGSSFADSKALENLEFESIQNDLVVDSTLKSVSGSSPMTSNVRAYDPINRKRYQKTILGPVKTNRNIFKRDYTHYRYVTVYNISKKMERLAYLPFFHEDCFDDNYRMASWEESKTFSVRLDSSIGVKGLGLSASVGASITSGVSFSTRRSIQATKGIEARHYPYKVSESYNGVTYIQTYNSKTRGYGYLKGNQYPMRFGLNNQNLGLRVKREIIRTCSN